MGLAALAFKKVLTHRSQIMIADFAFQLRRRREANVAYIASLISSSLVFFVQLHNLHFF